MKKLAILLTIALLLSLFAGCQERQPGQTSASTGETQPEESSAATGETQPDVTLYCPAPISLYQREQIDKAFSEEDSEYIADWYSEENPRGHCRYYGSDNGYDIFFYDGGNVFFSYKIHVIAGEAFGNGNYFGLYAHKDGELLRLEDAYEAGLVSKEAIAAAREVHNQCIHYDFIADCCPAPVFRERQQKVEDAWLAAGNETFGEWYTEDNPDADWRYYGDYLMFYCGGEQEEVFTTIQIGDVTFSHPTTFQLYTLDVDWASLITMEDFYNQYGHVNQVEEAAQLHKQTNDAIYGEGWDSQENTQ